MPIYIEGFLRTLGLIFFLPNIWVGIVVAVLLLWNSRIQFLLAITSYALGTTIRGILTGTFIYVYFDPAALKFILVALAIGGYYLLPSPNSYILAAFGVALSALLSEAVSVFWAAVGLPVHALPYNIVTLLLLYVLGLVRYQLLARLPQSSPERTLDYELTARLRYPDTGSTLTLPFAGSWTVWQGFDGEWTHQGIWRYANDFLIEDEQGQTYQGSGLELTDYYAFQKPVLSPVWGWVVRVVKDLADGVVGEVRVKVKMAIDGSFYLDSGKGKLFFSRDEDKFMFHRLDGEDAQLALLFIAMPKLPLVRQQGQQWLDYLPAGIIMTGLQKMLYQFCSSFVPQLASAKFVGQWQADDSLIGTIAIPKIATKITTSVIFD